jgi:homoserine O-acetyltransferase
MMDSHDLGRGRPGGYQAAVKSIRQPCLIVGIDSDGLFPLAEQEELFRLLPHGEMEIIHSDEGHDGFLLEFEQMNHCLSRWLQRELPDYRSLLLTNQKRAKEFADFVVKKESVFGEAEVSHEW